jgi:hypothetical protein
LRFAEPAAQSFIAPLLDPETAATPAAKVRAVALPKLIAVPVESVTVGALPPGLEEAPEKVRLWEPV